MKKFTVKPRLTHAKRVLIGNQAEGRDNVFLGRLAEVGQLVRVDFDLFEPHVIAVFGKRGSGKSYTLGSLLEGLCTREKHNTISTVSKTRAALLFDTLGIFQWLDVPLRGDSPQTVIREQAQAQKGWGIQSEPLEVEIWAPRGTPSLVRGTKELTINCADFTASDWGHLMGVDILQDRVGQLLNDGYEKVVNEGWSDGSSTLPPRPRYAIEDLIECIQKDTELLSSYHGETRRAVLQQLSVYWRNPLFQPKRRIPTALKRLLEKGEMCESELRAYESIEGTSLNDLLKPGSLSVLLLHRIPDELRSVVILSVIRKIMDARIQTSEMEKNLRLLPDLPDSDRREMEEAIMQGIPPTWIVADEAQNFLPSERKTGATDVLVKLVREGRNFGLSFVLTTQQPSAIDPRILAQVDTLMVHKLTVQGDIEYVKRNLKSGLPQDVRYTNRVLAFDDLLRTLDTGQAVVSNTDAERAFVMEVRPRVSVHGGLAL